MLRITNIPLEKISDKQVASIEEGMTWMDKELPEKLDMEEVKQVMRRKFEEKMAQELLPKYESDE